MFGLVVIEVMTPSGHLSNINENTLMKKENCLNRPMCTPASNSLLEAGTTTGSVFLNFNSRR